MKQVTYLTTIVFAVIAVTMIGCDGKRDPGKVYMPDMAYGRAVETYAMLNDTVFTENPNDPKHRIYYNRMPVNGTVAIGELPAYNLTNDSTGYKLSSAVVNPLAATPLSGADSVEAGRLYNINCGICHGADAKASGPLAVSGKIGGVANLTSGVYLSMTDGTMFHSITYGKGLMGSYASQLNRKQRWQVIQYVRTLQPKAVATAAAPAGTAKPTAAVADTTKKI
ncbi:MAG: cytochrome c [Bacteroidota bacterium]